MLAHSIPATPSTGVAGSIVIEVTNPAVLDTVQQLTAGAESIDVVLMNRNEGKRQRETSRSGRSKNRGAERKSRQGRRIVVGELSGATQLVSAISTGVWAVVPDNELDIHDSLLTVIEQVAAGKCPLLKSIADDTEAASAMLTALASSAGVASIAHPSPLTTGEVDILSRIAQGHTSRQIAEDLGFHLQTVKNKVTTIFGKTGARSRTQAAAIAQMNGWIKVSQD